MIELSSLLNGNSNPTLFNFLSPTIIISQRDRKQVRDDMSEVHPTHETVLVRLNPYRGPHVQHHHYQTAICLCVMPGKFIASVNVTARVRNNHEGHKNTGRSHQHIGISAGRILSPLCSLGGSSTLLSRPDKNKRESECFIICSFPPNVPSLHLTIVSRFFYSIESKNSLNVFFSFIMQI